MNDLRAPARWCTYPGDVAAAIARDIQSGVPKGPTTLGEPLWPVTATYDGQTDRTRVGWSYIPPQSGEGR